MATSHWKTAIDFHSYDQYMLFIAIAGKAFLFTQIAKIIQNENSENVSFFSYLIYFITSFSWLLFGLLHKETIVTVSSSIGIFGGLMAMVTILYYKDDKTDIF